MSKSYFKGSLLATTVITGMAFALPAHAQDAPANQDPTPTNVQGTGTPAPSTDENPEAGVQSSESTGPAEPTSSEEIVVTGTLIRNPNLVASAPVTVVGQEEIQLRQSNVAEEVLRTIPGVVPSVGSAVNNGNGGASFVNLRGIGSNRNLVLLDGVRLVPSDLVGRVDLNNIPLALVDRVDVLTGGASSTYGADAVGGVVNFITRSDFAGMELSASDQITERGDGNFIRTDLTLGANFDDGRGNAVVSVGYQESDPVYQGGDREFAQVSIESYAADCIVCQGSSTTVPTRINFGGGQGSRQVDLTGSTLVPVFNRFNFNPFNVFQTPFKRYNLFAAGHYDVAENVTVYGRGLYSNNTVDTIIAPSGVFNQSVQVNANNPFITPAQLQVLCQRADTDPTTPGNQVLGAGTAECLAAGAATGPDDPNARLFTFNVQRRTTEVGPRISSYNTQIFDFRAGVRGDITESIGYDVFGARGESTNTQRIQNYVLVSRFREALLADDTTLCRSGNVDCVPINIFGPEGSITPEQADFISDESSTRTFTRLSQARGTINGDVGFQLPWAAQPIGFAVGTEYRKYSAQNTSDILAKTPGELGGAGGANPDVDGGFDVYEGFAEVIAPIASDRPFFQDLTLEAGVRRSGYTVDAPDNPKFKTTTWKIAGSWTPVNDLKVRGNYQRAVRAPNIGELFTPISTGLTNLGSDPCAGAAPLLNANLAAICIAQGADPLLLGTIEDPVAGQANVTGGGDPNIQPEKASTWTIGTVLRPSFLPGFTATIDYYNIEVEDAISTPTPGDLIAVCFGSDPANPPAGAATDPNCTRIRRNPNDGSLSGDPADTPGLFAPLTNFGYIKTDGVDLTMNYRRDLGVLVGAPAKINLSFGGNYTRRSIFNGDVTSPASFNRECTGFYSVNCASIQPKYQFNQRTTLSLGRVDMSLLWRYIHKVRFEPQQFEDDLAAAIAGGCTDPEGADPDGCLIDPEFRKIKAHNYFDFATRFNVTDNFDMTVTVMNLLDKDPPVVGNTIGSTLFNSGNTFPSTYDALGRRFAVGARIKF
jgi:outer membrane receptor protein involved in Fe transport